MHKKPIEGQDYGSMPFETLWCCVPPSSRSSPGRKDNACDIRSVLLVPWVVGLYRDSRGGAIVAALDAGKDSRRYDVCVVLNLVVLESGRKSLLVSCMRAEADDRHMRPDCRAECWRSTRIW